MKYTLFVCILYYIGFGGQLLQYYTKPHFFSTVTLWLENRRSLSNFIQRVHIFYSSCRAVQTNVDYSYDPTRV